MGIQTTATCDACKNVIDVSRGGDGYSVNTSNSARLNFQAPEYEWAELLFCPKCCETLVELLQLELEVRLQKAPPAPRASLPGRLIRNAYGVGMNGAYGDPYAAVAAQMPQTYEQACTVVDDLVSQEQAAIAQQYVQRNVAEDAARVAATAQRLFGAGAIDQ